MRSLSPPTANTVGPIKDQFHGLLSAHFVGETQSGDSSVENGSDDGLFRHWEMARWAKRMRLDKNFVFDDGSVKVGQPGVYFIYAQVNYISNLSRSLWLSTRRF